MGSTSPRRGSRSRPSCRSSAATCGTRATPRIVVRATSTRPTRAGGRSTAAPSVASRASWAASMRISSARSAAAAWSRARAASSPPSCCTRTRRRCRAPRGGGQGRRHRARGEVGARPLLPPAHGADPRDVIMQQRSRVIDDQGTIEDYERPGITLNPSAGPDSVNAGIPLEVRAHHGRVALTTARDLGYGLALIDVPARERCGLRRRHDLGVQLPPSATPRLVAIRLHMV